VRRFAPQLFAQLFCISLFVLAISNSQAQIPSRTITQGQIQSREWALGILRPNDNLNKVSRQPEDRTKLQAQVALRNDFRHLQVVNNQLMARVFERTDEKITHREIRACLGEIQKLAERLRLNFGIPKLKSNVRTSGVELKPGLLQLDKAVVGFVQNPYFQQPRIYDSEQVSRAGRDIGEVLRLTDQLRRLTKELKEE